MSADKQLYLLNCTGAGFFEYLSSNKQRYNWKIGLYLSKLSSDVEARFCKPVYRKKDFVKIKNMECVQCSANDKFEKFHLVKYSQIIKFHEIERISDYKEHIPKAIEDANLLYFPVKILKTDKSDLSKVIKGKVHYKIGVRV